LISAKTADGKETSYRYDAAGRLTEESGVSATKEYTYGWLDKVMKVRDTGKSNSEVDFSYHIDGQLASRRSGDKVENFYWDDLALVKKDGTDYINEPYATGGNPVLANDEVMFNDMLGTTLGSVDNGKFSSTPTTAFGAGNENAFFTGKPHVEGLGYAFMFRNYRPEMGKWQTADPLGYPDGWNNFAYCNNWVTDCIDWQGSVGISLQEASTRCSAYAEIDVKNYLAGIHNEMEAKSKDYYLNGHYDTWINPIGECQVTATIYFAYISDGSDGDIEGLTYRGISVYHFTISNMGIPNATNSHDSKYTTRVPANDINDSQSASFSEKIFTSINDAEIPAVIIGVIVYEIMPSAIYKRTGAYYE